MIPTQKAVNWLMGMNVLSAQDTAWPKLLVKENALRQEITNQPGEIIRTAPPPAMESNICSRPIFQALPSIWWIRSSRCCVR